MRDCRKVAIVVGILRQESWSRKPAHSQAALARTHNLCSVSSIGRPPVYNQDLDLDLDLDLDPPSPWTGFHQTLRVADAFLFLTPEYQLRQSLVILNLAATPQPEADVTCAV